MVFSNEKCLRVSTYRTRQLLAQVAFISFMRRHVELCSAVTEIRALSLTNRRQTAWIINEVYFPSLFDKLIRTMPGSHLSIKQGCWAQPDNRKSILWILHGLIWVLLLYVHHTADANANASSARSVFSSSEVMLENSASTRLTHSAPA